MRIPFQRGGVFQPCSTRENDYMLHPVRKWHKDCGETSGIKLTDAGALPTGASLAQIAAPVLRRLNRAAALVLFLLDTQALLVPPGTVNQL